MAQVEVSTVPESYLKLIARFWLRPIRTEDELDLATTIVNELAMRDDLDEAEEDFFDVLTDLVEAYEAAHYPMPRLSGLEILRGIMEDRGLSQVDVARGSGISTSTLNDVLTERRKLNLKHINALAAYFKLPESVFLTDARSQTNEPASD